ncbi:MAG: hypothetical protein IKP07_01660 [Bacilli bacterium]|nr:hypothetical protein [Bacilli bacterium]
MYLLSIGDLITKGIAGVIILLDCIIYGLIGSAYKIFMAIASARLLTSDAYSTIANNLYAIIGVIMLFVLAYAIIRAIMDPDQMTKGELSGSSLVKNIAIAVIGLAIAPTIFEYLYQAQGLFVEHDVVGKIFFRNFDDNEIPLGTAGIGTSANDPCQDQSNQTAKANCYVKSIGGAVAATSIWSAFFHPAEGYTADEITITAQELYDQAALQYAGCAVAAGLAVAAVAMSWNPIGWLLGGAAVLCCAVAIGTSQAADNVQDLTNGDEISLADAYNMSSSGKGFSIYTGFIGKYQDDGEIEYMWGVSTLCGIFALYSFVSFSIDMGVRAAKLAYYQIIAPIPIILQILPKFKKNFTSYVTNLIQTFMEVFIRISVVYIVVYIICHLTDLFSSTEQLWGNQNLNWGERALALALLIMGLIIFAQSAPKIITESLGIGGGMGDFKSLGKKLKEGGFFGAAGLAGSMFRGAQHGYNDEEKNRHGQDPRFRDRLGRAFSGAMSATTRNLAHQFGESYGRDFSNNWRNMRDNVADSAHAADEARHRRGEKQREHQAALDAIHEGEDQLSQLDEIIAAANAGRTLDDAQKKILEKLAKQNDAGEWLRNEDAIKALENEIEAQQKIRVKTWVTRQVSDAIERDVNAHGRPLYDTAREREKMDYATALKKHNGELRDMAYEEEGTFAAQKHREYVQEQQRKISRYGNGLDDDTVRDEVAARRQRLSSASSEDMLRYLKTSAASMQERLSTDTSLSDAERTALTSQLATYNGYIGSLESGVQALQTTRSDLAAKQRAIENTQAQISSLDPSDAAGRAALQSQLTTLQTEREALETSLASQTQAMEVATDPIRTKVTAGVQAQVDFEYKLTDAQFANATQEQADKVKKLKEESEAAADAWIHSESQNEGSKVADKISTFVASHIAYVQAHEGEVLRTGDDPDSPSMTIRETMERIMGKDNYRAGQYSAATARADSSYNSHNEFEFEQNGTKKKVYYRRNVTGWSNGQPVYGDTFGFYDTALPAENAADTAPHFKNEAEFFSQAKGIKATTAQASMGKFGNDSAKYTNAHEYAPKAQRAMQQKEGKKGNKG